MNDQVENEGSALNLKELVAMAFRGRYWIVLSAILGLMIAAGAVFLQKPMYRSQATLLIESQQIPSSVVAAPLASIADERIAKIRQQIVSNDSLTRLIRAEGLYQQDRARLPLASVRDTMRNAVGVDLVSADKSNGGGSTIAFNLSFTYEDAKIAQRVTGQLTKMFLVEDKRFRTEQANGTAEFLQNRSEELRSQLSELEDKRRAVEARYAGALPESVALSAQSGAALRAEISRTDSETQGLVQQSSLLAVRTGDAARPPQPGVEAVRRAEERLNQLSAVYVDDYPDVRAARAAVRVQRQALENSPREAGNGLIETEIASARARILMLAARRSELLRQLADIEHRSAQAPQAAYELNTIGREYDNLKRQYESLREKQLDAQVAANLQTEDKGERFSVVDEPTFPQASLGTNPVKLLFLGLVAGAAAGVVLVIGIEILNGRIHGEATLTRIMNAPPLAIISDSARKQFLLPLPGRGLFDTARAVAASFRVKSNGS